jgi:hypothetical protein
MTIIAQDPSVKRPGSGPRQIVTAQVDVPDEELGPGPRGYRVQVIDYDASTDTLYAPRKKDLDDDPYVKASDAALLSDPHFHAQNVYAIVMRTLARFEFALGRRVSWGFNGHQIQVAPHAFADANAFYSERDRALAFGYFPQRDEPKKMVFSCLSHDVVVHETTHALVDGLRERYTDPSSPEQAGFHEGFADVVALLSVFALRDVVGALLDLSDPGAKTIAQEKVTPEALKNSILGGLAEQMGAELSGIRAQALRTSVKLPPSTKYISSPEFLEPHRRGELFAAAIMNAFIKVWVHRLGPLGQVSKGRLDRERVVEEGAEAASNLLTMSIRALDYSTPTDVEFCDFLSALLTADREIVPDDTRYHYRDVIRKSFAEYGMQPTSKDPGGVWEPPQCELIYNRTHFEPMQRDPDEVFRFIWENRKGLGLYEDAYSLVQSVRPCMRIGPDGFFLRETVVEYVQMISLQARELGRLKIDAPAGMSLDTNLTLYGGGALIFDEFGRLKFNVCNRIDNFEKQTRRLKFLWQYGYFNRGTNSVRRFAQMHRLRASNTPLRFPED